jgi:hypothetical protein
VHEAGLKASAGRSDGGSLETTSHHDLAGAVERLRFDARVFERAGEALEIARDAIGTAIATG